MVEDSERFIWSVKSKSGRMERYKDFDKNIIRRVIVKIIKEEDLNTFRKLLLRPQEKNDFFFFFCRNLFPGGKLKVLNVLLENHRLK